MDVFGFIILGFLSGGLLALMSSVLFSWICTKEEDRFKKLVEKNKDLSSEVSRLESLLKFYRSSNSNLNNRISVLLDDYRLLEKKLKNKDKKEKK